MKITYEGRGWEFDVEDMTVAQCETVEKFTENKGLGGWSLQLEAANTRAVVALWWVIRQQAGDGGAVIGEPGDGFRPLRLAAAFAAAAAAEGEGVPDPTGAAEASPAGSGGSLTAR